MTSTIGDGSTPLKGPPEEGLLDTTKAKKGEQVLSTAPAGIADTADQVKQAKTGFEPPYESPANQPIPHPTVQPSTKMEITPEIAEFAAMLEETDMSPAHLIKQINNRHVTLNNMENAVADLKQLLKDTLPEDIERSWGDLLAKILKWISEQKSELMEQMQMDQGKIRDLSKAAFEKAEAIREENWKKILKARSKGKGGFFGKLNKVLKPMMPALMTITAIALVATGVGAPIAVMLIAATAIMLTDMIVSETTGTSFMDEAAKGLSGLIADMGMGEPMTAIMQSITFALILVAFSALGPGGLMLGADLFMRSNAVHNLIAQTGMGEPYAMVLSMVAMLAITFLAYRTGKAINPSMYAMGGAEVTTNTITLARRVATASATAGAFSEVVRSSVEAGTEWKNMQLEKEMGRIAEMLVMLQADLDLLNKMKKMLLDALQGHMSEYSGAADVATKLIKGWKTPTELGQSQQA